MKSKTNVRKKAVKIPKGEPQPEVRAIIEPEDCDAPEALRVPSDFPWTLAIAEDAMRHIDPSIERGEWFKVLAALVTQFGKTDEVKRLVERWSAGELHGGKTPENYRPAENERQWIDVEAGPYSMGSLYRLAVAGGWDPFPVRKQQAENEGAILTGFDDSRTIAKQVWDQIMKQEHEEQRLFRYGRQIARLDDEIDVLTAKGLWTMLANRITFTKVKQRRLVHCDPEENLITFIMNTPPKDIPLPELLGLTRTPVLAPDGSIHAAPGYSPISKMFHRPGVEVGAIPDRPTAREIKAARELLQEVICDFPFVHPSDRAHALALMILPFVRPMITGPTPIHFITKPVQGTGATLLGEVVTLIKTGRALEAANAPRTDEEWQKTIIAKLLQLPEFFFLDNVTRIKSEALATALTTDVYEGRRLGVSEIVRLPVRCAWIMTGNNPEMSADFPRRILHVRLDANMEHPERGREFLHKDLKGWVHEVRGRLIAAILTLSRAWVQEGSPLPSETMASFESWANVLGGILQVAGIDGFLKTPEDHKQFDDPWEQGEKEFVAAWLYHILKDPVIYQKAKPRVLLKMAEAGDLALGQGGGAKASEHGKVTAFGTRLMKIKDRTFVVLDSESFVAREPTAMATVKVIRMGSNSDSRWRLEVKEVKLLDPKSGNEEVRKEGDWAGINATAFWSPPAI
jgi:hypothetical protein